MMSSCSRRSCCNSHSSSLIDSQDRLTRRRKHHRQDRGRYRGGSPSERDRRDHRDASDPEVFELEISQLTRRVTESHLEQIFSSYGDSLQRVKKHPRDWSRALITFKDRQDAYNAYDHLAPIAHSKTSSHQNRNSKTSGQEEGKDGATIIDGKAIQIHFKQRGSVGGGQRYSQRRPPYRGDNHKDY